MPIYCIWHSIVCRYLDMAQYSIRKLQPQNTNLRYHLIAWVDISPNCPRSADISILAAYPMLSIFSVVGDMNDSVWYPLSVVNFKVKGRAFSPTPSKCTCISPSPVQLRTRISASAPPLSNCACAYQPSCHVNFRLGPWDETT